MIALAIGLLGLCLLASYTALSQNKFERDSFNATATSIQGTNYARSSEITTRATQQAIDETNTTIAIIEATNNALATESATP